VEVLVAKAIFEEPIVNPLPLFAGNGEETDTWICCF
jgi:hypothetical protein